MYFKVSGKNYGVCITKTNSIQHPRFTGDGIYLP